MAYTLAQLLAAQTETELTAALAAKLQAVGMPIESWLPALAGGLELANVAAIAGYLSGYATPKVAAMAASQILDKASGDLLTYRAAHFYRLTRRAARQTIQNITLSLDEAGSPLSFEAGDLWFRSKANHLYRSIDAVAFALNNENKYPAQKVRAEAYNDLGPAPGSEFNADGAGSITEMVTPYPDLEAKNEPPYNWTPQVVSGPSKGTITPYFAGIDPPGVYSTLKIRILSSGDGGDATFEWSTDGGLEWAASSVLHSGMSLDAKTKIQVADSTLVHPGFLAGDVFSFSVADAIVQYGTDDETDEALRARCRNRWPGLAEVPTAGLIDLWAHEASEEVDRVISQADLTTAGLTHVRISSAQGPASPGAIVAVQAYISDRLAIDGGSDPSTGLAFERVSVTSVDVLQLLVETTIKVRAADLEAVQAAAQINWSNYLKSVPIGGKVLFSELGKAIMDAGAVNFNLWSTPVNGVSSAYTPFIQLGPTEVAVPAGAGLLGPSVIWETT